MGNTNCVAKKNSQRQVVKKTLRIYLCKSLKIRVGKFYQGIVKLKFGTLEPAFAFLIQAICASICHLEKAILIRVGFRAFCT
jgi:hypothetical protein